MLIDIVLPQVRGTLLVGLVLSFVTMLSVLSVPLMINPNSPTMITVDVAYRINTFADYAVANALCLLSLLLAAVGAAFYLRHAVKRVETGAVNGGPHLATIAVDALGPNARRARSCWRCSRSSSSGRCSNLVLWAFAERWYFPSKLPSQYGFTFWERVFAPRGNAIASLGTSVWIAVLTVAFSLAVAIPAGYALGAAEAAVARR